MQADGTLSQHSERGHGKRGLYLWDLRSLARHGERRLCRGTGGLASLGCGPSCLLKPELRAPRGRFLLVVVTPLGASFVPRLLLFF